MYMRKAIVEDAPLLSDLAYRSKAHWGYDQPFMEACRDALTITADYIRSNPVYVLEVDQCIVGFYSFLVEDEKLDCLFLEPDWIGKGLGKRMWSHVLQGAKECGLSSFTLDSDPYAEPFYLKRGAVKIGEIESTAIAGRKLPILQVSVNEI